EARASSRPSRRARHLRPWDLRRDLPGRRARLEGRRSFARARARPTDIAPLNFTIQTSVVSGMSMARPALLCALLFACSHAARRGPGALVRQLVEQRQMRKRAAMVEDAPPPPDGGEPKETMRNGSLKRDAISQLAQAKLMRAVYSRRQLQEVMTDFWFNHFNVFAGKQEEAALLPDYEQSVIRAHALGSFPELLEATAHSAAMLIYLDNW